MPSSRSPGALTTATIAGSTAVAAVPTATVAAATRTREEVLALAHEGITHWLSTT